jgi:NAD(P)H-hydrate epimerase
MIFMTREQMRRYDEIAMQRYGLVGPVLMENAGRGAARVALSMLERRPGRTTVVCGKGNNGGDGFVIARHLLNAGREVAVLLLGNLSQLDGDAELNAGVLTSMGGDVTELPGEADVERMDGLLEGSALVVDAIFGTGLDRPVMGRYNGAIDAVNECDADVLSVDLPSGLDADSGRPLNTCVRAARTATFACLKRGLLLHPGCELAGEVEVVDIGAPRAVAEEAGIDGRVITAEHVAPLLPPRPADAHKGTFGHLLVVAGSAGKTGAALMAALSALRSGTGLVTLAVPGDERPALESAKPVEVMLAPLLTSIDAPVGDEELSRLRSLLEGKTAVAIGPGCGLTRSMGRVLEAVLEIAGVPVAVDADGLTLLGDLPPRVLADRSHPTVLTPHPGEMARLVDATPRAVQGRRVEAARDFAVDRGVHLVLKGARTVVAAPDSTVMINLTGNSGMATGGTGDVLTGLLGGLLAQSMAPLDAAAAAVHVHGLAGDLAAEVTGGRSLLASDLVEALPEALGGFEER